MTLIHNYIYKEVLLLTGAIIGVLTFLLVTVGMFKVIQVVLYTDLSMWVTARFVLMLVPSILTLTIPAGLLAGVMIVFGRMSSDRELLALKASGIGLAPIVAPVVILAALFCAVNFWLVEWATPESKKESHEMLHDIVTNNPMSIFTPEMDIDKIPGWRIWFASKSGNELRHIALWRLSGDQNNLTTSLRADRATVTLDIEHQQLLLTLFNQRGEEYPSNGDPAKVHLGAHAAQSVIGVPLASFSDKAQKKLSWMTLPEIQDVIYAMQSAPTGQLATPYLTEFQARFAFALSCLTFVIVGLPLAIQTQRRETSVGVVMTILIVLFWFVLIQVGRALKAKAGLYPELIIWAPNILFQFIGGWLFYRANQK